MATSFDTFLDRALSTKTDPEAYELLVQVMANRSVRSYIRSQLTRKVHKTPLAEIHADHCQKLINVLISYDGNDHSIEGLLDELRTDTKHDKAASVLSAEFMTPKKLRVKASTGGLTPSVDFGTPDRSTEASTSFVPDSVPRNVSSSIDSASFLVPSTAPSEAGSIDYSRRSSEVSLSVDEHLARLRQTANISRLQKRQEEHRFFKQWFVNAHLSRFYRIPIGRIFVRYGRRVVHNHFSTWRLEDKRVHTAKVFLERLLPSLKDQLTGPAIRQIFESGKHMSLAKLVNLLSNPTASAATETVTLSPQLAKLLSTAKLDPAEVAKIANVQRISFRWRHLPAGKGFNSWVSMIRAKRLTGQMAKLLAKLCVGHVQYLQSESLDTMKMVSQRMKKEETIAKQIESLQVQAAVQEESKKMETKRLKRVIFLQEKNLTRRTERDTNNVQMLTILANWKTFVTQQRIHRHLLRSIVTDMERSYLSNGFANFRRHSNQSLRFDIQRHRLKRFFATIESRQHQMLSFFFRRISVATVSAPVNAYLMQKYVLRWTNRPLYNATQTWRSTSKLLTNATKLYHCLNALRKSVLGKHFHSAVRQTFIQDLTRQLRQKDTHNVTSVSAQKLCQSLLLVRNRRQLSALNLFRKKLSSHIDGSGKCRTVFAALGATLLKTQCLKLFGKFKGAGRIVNTYAKIWQRQAARMSFNRLLWHKGFAVAQRNFKLANIAQSAHRKRLATSVRLWQTSLARIDQRKMGTYKINQLLMAFARRNIFSRFREYLVASKLASSVTVAEEKIANASLETAVASKRIFILLGAQKLAKFSGSKRVFRKLLSFQHECVRLDERVNNFIVQAVFESTRHKLQKWRKFVESEHKRRQKNANLVNTMKMSRQKKLIRQWKRHAAQGRTLASVSSRMEFIQMRGAFSTLRGHTLEESKLAISDAVHNAEAQLQLYSKEQSQRSAKLLFKYFANHCHANLKNKCHAVRSLAQTVRNILTKKKAKALAALRVHTFVLRTEDESETSRKMVSETGELLRLEGYTHALRLLSGMLNVRKTYKAKCRAWSKLHAWRCSGIVRELDAAVRMKHRLLKGQNKLPSSSFGSPLHPRQQEQQPSENMARQVDAEHAADIVHLKDKCQLITADNSELKRQIAKLQKAMAESQTDQLTRQKLEKEKEDLIKANQELVNQVQRQSIQLTVLTEQSAKHQDAVSKLEELNREVTASTSLNTTLESAIDQLDREKELNLNTLEEERCRNRSLKQIIKEQKHVYRRTVLEKEEEMAQLHRKLFEFEEATKFQQRQIDKLRHALSAAGLNGEERDKKFAEDKLLLLRDMHKLMATQKANQKALPVQDDNADSIAVDDKATAAAAVKQTSAKDNIQKLLVMKQKLRVRPKRHDCLTPEEKRLDWYK